LNTAVRAIRWQGNAYLNVARLIVVHTAADNQVAGVKLPAALGICIADARGRSEKQKRGGAQKMSIVHNLLWHELVFSLGVFAVKTNVDLAEGAMSKRG